MDLLVPTQVPVPALGAHPPLTLSYRELTPVAFSLPLALEWGSPGAEPEVPGSLPAPLPPYLSRPIANQLVQKRKAQLLPMETEQTLRHNLDSRAPHRVGASL